MLAVPPGYVGTQIRVYRLNVAIWVEELAMLGRVSLFIDEGKIDDEGDVAEVTVATAEADWSQDDLPKMRRRTGWSSRRNCSVRTVTFAALTVVVEAVKVRAVASQTPDCTSGDATCDARPPTMLIVPPTTF